MARALPGSTIKLKRVKRTKGTRTTPNWLSAAEEVRPLMANIFDPAVDEAASPVFAPDAAAGAGADALIRALLAQGKAAVQTAKLPGRVMAGEVDPLSDEGIGGAFDMAGMAMTGGIGGAPVRAGETAIGSGPILAYHGSPHDFDAIRPSTRGPLGPAVYASPAENVAGRYKGADGHMYEVEVPGEVGFKGISGMVDGPEIATFDARLVNILRKYGIAGAAVLPAAAEIAAQPDALTTFTPSAEPVRQPAPVSDRSHAPMLGIRG
jgi:hypothetical protein